MNWDVLLHWMTHVGEGSWGAFRGTVSKLAETDADIDDLCRKLRIALSDLGHAEFFVEGSRRWRVLPPVLGGLTSPSGTALFSGGRTPKLAATLADAAANRGCRIAIDSNGIHPACFRLEGRQNALMATAADAGITYVDSFGSALCAAIQPLPIQLENAPLEAAPANWTVRSFDFGLLTWVEGLRSRSACEFRSRYGPRRFYVHSRRRRFVRLPKREAVYAAAMLREVRLAVYDEASRMLSSPVSAPLPESYSRVACLCTGTQADVKHGRLHYRDVPPEVAAVLLVAAGQPYPELRQTAKPLT